MMSAFKLARGNARGKRPLLEVAGERRDEAARLTPSPGGRNSDRGAGLVGLHAPRFAREPGSGLSAPGLLMGSLENVLS